MLKNKTNRILILFIIIFLNACDFQSTIESNINRTWACDGLAIDQAGETFYPNGQFSRFTRKTKNGEKIALYEGKYNLNGTHLSISFKRLTNNSSLIRNNIARKILFQENYRVTKITPYLLELKKMESGFIKIKTCRFTDEFQLGSSYRYALKGLSTKGTKESKSTIRYLLARSHKSRKKYQSKIKPISKDKKLEIKVAINKFNSVSVESFVEQKPKQLLTQKYHNIEITEIAVSSKKDIKVGKQSINNYLNNYEKNILENGWESVKLAAHNNVSRGSTQNNSKRLSQYRIKNNSVTKNIIKNKKLAILLQAKEKLLLKARSIDNIYRRNIASYQVIKAVSNSITSHLSLYAIDKKGSFYKVQGTAKKHYQLKSFIKNLEKSSYISNINVKSLRRSGGFLNFTMYFRQRKIQNDYKFIAFKSIKSRKNVLRYHQNQYKELKLIVRALIDSMPGRRLTFNFIGDIELVARESGLLLGKPVIINEVTRNPIAYYPVRIKAIGNYKAYMTFMNTLVRMRFATHIQKLSLSPLTKKRNSKLNISVLLRVYTHPKKSNPNVKTINHKLIKTINFTPYKIVTLDNHGILWNPFVRFKGKIKSYCDGPFSSKGISRLKLVRIVNKVDKIAIFKSSEGFIYRARRGTCIAKNTKINKIYRRTIKLHRVWKNRMGRAYINVKKISIK